MPSIKATPNAAAWPTAAVKEFCDLTSEDAIEEVEIGPFAVQHSKKLGAPVPTVSPATQAIALPMGVTVSDQLRLIAEHGEQRRKKRLEDLWTRVTAHTIYSRLKSDHNFQEVLKVFRGKQKHFPRSAYGSDYAELRLLNVVVLVVGAQSNHPNASPKIADRETAKQALGHAKKLRACMGKGIRLSGWRDSDKFRALLNKLIVETEQTYIHSRKRKPRSDQNTPRRFYTDFVLRALQGVFKDASPKIVAGIVAMMDYTPDDSTIRRSKAKLGRAQGD